MRGWRLLGRLFIAAASLVVSLELCGLLLVAVLFNQCAYSPSAVKGFREALRVERDAGGSKGKAPVPTYALHPYVGFVSNADSPARLYSTPISPTGFHSDVPAAYRKTSANEFVVGLFGGSVTVYLNVRAAETLKRELARAPALRGRTVVINAIAEGGWKQPQQMLALDYYLLMGAQFDLVVNLDGVNEVAIAFMNGTTNGFEPTFPHAWSWFAELNPGDPELLEHLTTGLGARNARAALARVLLDSHLTPSAAVRLVWGLGRRVLMRREVMANNALNDRFRTDDPERLSFQQTGPWRGRRGDPGEVLAQAVRVWEEGSFAMAERLRARNIPYVHVLQPNQHFAGTKPLTEAERASFANPKAYYAMPLARGYPLLLAAGRKLRAREVDFIDLSRVFAETAIPVFEDDCCHFNDEGNRILATQLAAVLASRIK